MKERLKKEKITHIQPMETTGDFLHLHFEEGYIFPQETIDALQGLCEILKGIRNRLTSKGYSIMEGKLISPNGEILYERNNSKNR